MDTIFALASARGKAGVAVIRISGGNAWEAARCLSGDLPIPRKSALRKLVSRDGGHLDDAIVLLFENGRSFTGEESAELHVHGSTATVNAVLSELSAIPGLRLAEPGEFTRRALENERLDLSQVEGLADLVEAETELQRRQALRVLSGALGQIVEGWRFALIRAAALLEATIDFADEDVPEDVTPEVLELLNSVLLELQKEDKGSHAAERIRDGFEVAIVGRPNVGKSTLLNSLAGRDAAITSDVAGTTRDVIEVRMDLRGLAVTLLDTAGVRDAMDPVEEIGIARTITRAKDADLRVFIIENQGDKPIFDPLENDLVILGKADLVEAATGGVSGLTGQGVTDLVEEVTSRLERLAASAGTITRLRHREAIRNAIDTLVLAEAEVRNGPERAEVAAEEIRTTIRALDSLVGRIDVEDVLDEIFGSFCLGK